MKSKSKNLAKEKKITRDCSGSKANKTMIQCKECVYIYIIYVHHIHTHTHRTKRKTKSTTQKKKRAKKRVPTPPEHAHFNRTDSILVANGVNLLVATLPPFLSQTPTAWTSFPSPPFSLVRAGVRNQEIKVCLILVLPLDTSKRVVPEVSAKFPKSRAPQTPEESCEPRPAGSGRLHQSGMSPAPHVAAQLLVCVPIPNFGLSLGKPQNQVLLLLRRNHSPLWVVWVVRQGRGTRFR